MASNPNVNKVVYGNDTLIDLTADTVKADNLLEGYTAHSKSGAVITGAVPNYYKYNASKRLRYSDIDPSVATSCFLVTDTSVKILLGLGAFSYGIKISVSGTNIILSSYDETTEDISTITLSTVGASYTKQFYVKEVIVLDPYSFLITYYSANGTGTYTAQSLRLIRIKEDGTLSQSSAITIANATTTSLKCWAKVIPMFEGGNQSWMAVQVRETISSGARLIYATRIYANFTTGALTIPSSSAWVTVASSNVNVSIVPLNLILDYGGFEYTNSNSYGAFFIWHGYNNGYVNKTKSDLGLDDIYSVSRIILGKLASGAVVFCDQHRSLSKSYVDLIIFMYDYVSQKFVSKKIVRITKSSNSVRVVGMQGDVVIFSNGSRYQLVFDGTNNEYLAKQLPKINDVGASAPQRYGKYENVGSESNRLMNLYIDDAE